MILFSLVTVSVVTLASTGVWPTEARAAGGGGGGGDFGGGGGGGAKEAKIKRAYQEGVELLAEKDCAKADRKFRTVLRATPKNAEANYLRGAALMCQEKYRRAVPLFKKAIRYDKDLYAAYHQLGLAYLQTEKREEASAELEKLAQMVDRCGESCSRKLTRAHRRLQRALAPPAAESQPAADGTADDGSAVEVEAGSDEDAELDGQDAFRASPTRAPHALLFAGLSEPRSVYMNAVELIHSARFEAAIARLREVAQTVGPDPDVLNYLGYAHRQLGLFDQSLGYYQQALEIDPDHRGANEYLGELYTELGQLELAREQLAVLDALCPFGCAEYEDLRRAIESRAVASH